MGILNLENVIFILCVILGFLVFSAYKSGAYEEPCPGATTAVPHASTYTRSNGRCVVDTCDKGYTIQGDSCVETPTDEPIDVVG
jgi:hypothetical protein